MNTLIWCVLVIAALPLFVLCGIGEANYRAIKRKLRAGDRDE